MTIWATTRSVPKANYLVVQRRNSLTKEETIIPRQSFQPIAYYRSQAADQNSKWKLRRAETTSSSNFVFGTKLSITPQMNGGRPGPLQPIVLKCSAAFRFLEVTVPDQCLGTEQHLNEIDPTERPRAPRVIGNLGAPFDDIVPKVALNIWVRCAVKTGENQNGFK
jgi:hypothetical protein